jgi:hypothetical protein
MESFKKQRDQEYDQCGENRTGETGNPLDQGNPR